MTNKYSIFLLLVAIICGTVTQVTGANNQTVILTGTCNLDGIGLDVDTAWLYIGRYDVDLDSVIVSPQSEGWGGGYRYARMTTADSAGGWWGKWVYVDADASARAGEMAVVVEAPDSSLGADTTGLALSAYAEFIDGSNEDQFKATGFAEHSQIDSLKDTTEDMSTRLLATGFATHAQTDSLKDTVENMSTRLLATGFAEHAQVDSLKDTVEDMSGRLLATDFASHSQVDSLKDTVEDMSTRLLADVSALATSAQATALIDSANVIHQKLFFQGLADSAGGSSPWSEAEVDSILNSVLDANKPNFMADVSGLSILDSAFLSTFLKRLIFGIPQGSGSDSTTLAQRLVTASGLGSGDTNQYSLADVIDAIAAAVGDSNLARYSKRADYKADISSLSTLADADIRSALHDSLYTVRMDSLVSVLALATTTDANVQNLVYYWGACDGCYYRLYPEGGFANKDSAIIIDPSQVDSLVGKVIYLHGTEVDVVDTSYFYRDEPW